MLMILHMWLVGDLQWIGFRLPPGLSSRLASVPFDSLSRTFLDFLVRPLPLLRCILL